MTGAVVSAEQRRARWILVAIAGIPISMMLAATALWWAVEEGHVDIVGGVGTANHGELINPPRNVTGTVFQHEGGADTVWKDLPAKWRLLVVLRGDVCDNVCQDQLYQTRQIHVALGKEFNRVGRVVLGDVKTGSVAVSGSDAESQTQNGLLDWLAHQHVGVISLTLSPAELAALLPEAVDQPQQWYVVDPAGWIMMRISDELYYKDVISDLRFLLKHSGG